MYAVGTITAVIFSGRLTDRLGRKPILLMSLFGGGATALLLSQINSPIAYVATLVVFGFLMECYRPASSALISDLVSEDQRAPALASMRVAMNLGYMIAVVFGGLIVEWNWRGLFWIDGLTSLLFGTVVLFKIPQQTRVPSEALGRELSSVLRLFHPRFAGSSLDRAGRRISGECCWLFTWH